MTNEQLQRWLIVKLRRLSLQWPARTEARAAARVERGKYRCNFCGGIYGPKQVHVDHVMPVIEVKHGFVDFNTYIPRLFCDSNNLQILCETCHGAKTLIEDNLRTKYKKKGKKK